jgi:uncharacterized protein YbcI
MPAPRQDLTAPRREPKHPGRGGLVRLGPRYRVETTARRPPGRFPFSLLCSFRVLIPQGSEEGEPAMNASDLSERGPRAMAISNAMTKLHREHYGRGPGGVRTVLGHDHVICFLEDFYTTVERTLLEAGESESVLQTRLAFQRAMEARFVAAVEEALGRKVRAFLSQVHIDPDISCEIFVLEPDQTNPPLAGVG